MGRARPGDMGFDIVHFNLHKTFTQPHGGGGPGPGRSPSPTASSRTSPGAQVVRRDAGNGSRPVFDLDFDRPKSIGRLRGFQGNYGVFVRSYAYILSLGADGLQEASGPAVLNANYLMARLAETADEHLPPAFDRTCMHEFVLTGGPMKKALGIPPPPPSSPPPPPPPLLFFLLLVDAPLLVPPTAAATGAWLGGAAVVVGVAWPRPRRTAAPPAPRRRAAPPARAGRGGAAGGPPAPLARPPIVVQRGPAARRGGG